MFPWFSKGNFPSLRVHSHGQQPRQSGPARREDRNGFVPSRMARLSSISLACGLALGALFVAPAVPGAEDAATIENRIRTSVTYLASDDRQGRGIGTDGLNQAAEYIAEQFRQFHLKTDLFNGTPFQTFKMSTEAELGPVNQVVLTCEGTSGSPPVKLELKLNDDFSPMGMSGSGKLDLPLVFVGYGITGKEEGYDDYAGIDVKGKGVIILRHEPQQANEQSKFNGTDHSQHAPFIRKVANAVEHGAAAIIFCTDEFDIRRNFDHVRSAWKGKMEALVALQAEFDKIEQPTTAQFAEHQTKVDAAMVEIGDLGKELKEMLDPMMPFASGMGGESVGSIPVIYCRRQAIDALLKGSLNTDLAALEKAIDEGPTPKSVELPGCQLSGEISILKKEVDVKNVVAILEGEGPLADETVVIGAHYDHLGFGGAGSLQPGSKDIHNGADDNGSGTASLLEIAHLLSSREKKLPRRVVFIAFTGEERGLVGSSVYCREPLIPMEKTVAMLNLDMVGRLDAEKLIIQGVDTSPEFGPIVDALNETYGFQITRQPGGFGPSDHSSFYGKKVPVMHFFTGTHPDYHKPSDDSERLNIQGMRRITEMVVETAVRVCELEKRPTYVEVQGNPMAAGGDRPFFGSVPDFSQTGSGYAISGTAKGSPADKAGFMGGDVIIQFGESPIKNLEDFDAALRKFKAGDKVPVIVMRGKEKVTLEVELEKPRGP